MQTNDVRAQLLLAELTGDKAWSRKHAKRLERLVRLCWWGSIALGGLASLAGFAASVPLIKSRIPIEPWHVSVLALLSSALVILRRKTAWRTKSDIFYGRERTVDSLINRLKYQITPPATPDQIG